MSRPTSVPPLCLIVSAPKRRRVAPVRVEQGWWMRIMQEKTPLSTDVLNLVRSYIDKDFSHTWLLVMIELRARVIVESVTPPTFQGYNGHFTGNVFAHIRNYTADVPALYDLEFGDPQGPWKRVFRVYFEPRHRNHVSCAGLTCAHDDDMNNRFPHNTAVVVEHAEFEN